MSEAGKSTRSCLSFVVLMGLILGALVGGWFYLQNRGTRKAEEAALAHSRTPEAYKDRVEVRTLKLEIQESNNVYLLGPAVNKGDKALSNVRVRLFFMTKPTAGEARPEFVDLGAFAAGETRQIRQFLYTIPAGKTVTYGGHYQVVIESVSF